MVILTLSLLSRIIFQSQIFVKDRLWRHGIEEHQVQWRYSGARSPANARQNRIFLKKKKKKAAQMSAISLHLVSSHEIVFCDYLTKKFQISSNLIVSQLVFGKVPAVLFAKLCTHRQWSLGQKLTYKTPIVIFPLIGSN